MEVTAHFETPVEGAWLVSWDPYPEATFCALVEPSSTETSVRILNVSDEPVTLYAGVFVATLQPVELPAAVNTDDTGDSPDVDAEK